MCELIAMSCHFPARLTRSLFQLAVRAHKPSVNRDGWGMAFWHDGSFEVYRDTHPADESETLQRLEASGPPARLCLGYIRHATHGRVDLLNTGPYTRRLGQMDTLFLHNGHLGRIMDSIRLQGRFMPMGNTDSEFVYCRLLEQLSIELNCWQCMSVEEQLQQIGRFALEIRAYGPANFLFAVGDTLFVHADRRLQLKTGSVEPPGMFQLHCPDSSASGLERDCRVPESDMLQEMMLFASQPLSDEPWQPMARGELLAVKQGRVLASSIIG